MDREELKSITEKIIELIDEHEIGERTTITELITELGLDRYCLDYEDMVAISRSVFNAAKVQGIVLDISGKCYETEYQPFLLEFIIYKDICVKNVRITANNMHYGPTAPKESDEIEQTLTISSTGKVCFTAQNYRQYREEKGTCRTRSLNIGKWKADFLCRMLSRLENQRYLIYDVGSFNVEITYNNGLVKNIFGFMTEDVFTCAYGDDMEVNLSCLIRRYIPIRRLWVLGDGAYYDYKGKKAICSFVEKWEKYFKDTSLNYYLEHEFGRECSKLGFQKDCSGAFIDVFGIQEGSGVYSKLEKGEFEILQSIDDIDIIGSGLYSYWYGLTRRDNMYNIGEKEQNVFLSLLRRLKELTKRNSKNEIQ